MPSKKELQDQLAQFTPEERGFAEAFATTKIENKVMAKQLADLKNSYEFLWKIFITILHAYPDKELRIHESQFLRFKNEYRIDRTFDSKTKEVILHLLTLNDEVPK